MWLREPGSKSDLGDLGTCGQGEVLSVRHCWTKETMYAISFRVEVRERYGRPSLIEPLSLYLRHEKHHIPNHCGPNRSTCRSLRADATGLMTCEGVTSAIRCAKDKTAICKSMCSFDCVIFLFTMSSHIQDPGPSECHIRKPESGHRNHLNVNTENRSRVYVMLDPVGLPCITVISVCPS